MIFLVIRLWGLLFLINLVLVVVALIGCLSTDEHAVRNLPKVVWVLLILLFTPIGPIAWFIAGRPRRQATGRAGGWRPGAGFPEHERPGRRPLGPDDDPDFLRNASSHSQRGAAREQADEDRELLRKWEADLRRREEELRRPQDEGEEPR